MTESFRNYPALALFLVICATAQNAAWAQSTGLEEKAPTNSQLASDEALISPLALPDTSSPRATLKSFVDNFDATFRPFHEGRTEKIPDRKSHTATRMFRTLDTSGLPPAQAMRRASEAVLLLNEVLSRVDIPPYEEIPDAETMQAMPVGEAKIWRIPRTDIQIVQVQEGPRAGEYLFSPDTLAHAGVFYNQIKNFAVRNGTTGGLYERIASEPGPLFPGSGFGNLPDWLRTTVIGQAVWKWIATVIIVAFWLFLIVVVFRSTRPREGHPRYWLRLGVALAMLPVTYAIRLFLERGIITIGAVYDLLDPFFFAAFYFFSAIALLNFGAGVAQLIIASPRIDSKSIDAHLIGITGRALAWVGVVLLILKGGNDIGIPLPAVIAGLGVGGLAIGIAARPTLENLIAGVTLYIDKPIRVGEFCQFGDVMGTVEQIGLRSTRIRRWGGNRVTVPNAQFAEFLIDNLNDVRNIWIRTRLSLRYETTPEQLRYVLAKLREMLFAHPRIVSPRVRFVELAESSLQVEILCYTDTGVWAEWHAIREDVYLRTLEIVKESGTAFAFPSQTTYFARDEGLDDERRQAAEQQVAAWRDADELPFPDMAADSQAALSDTLDFPPKGSATSEPKQATSDAPRKD